jgi:hypothetical protein
MQVRDVRGTGSLEEAVAFHAVSSSQPEANSQAEKAASSAGLYAEKIFFPSPTGRAPRQKREISPQKGK